MSDIIKLFPRTYAQADKTFRSLAARYGDVWDYDIGDTGYKIPVLTIGHGPHRFVINTGTHGIEGYMGSTIISKLLSECRDFLGVVSNSSRVQMVFIHSINAFGMDHFIRATKNNVDLNRNFIIDRKKFPPPQSPIPKQHHDLLTSEPGPKKDRQVRQLLASAPVSTIPGGKSLSALLIGGQYEYPGGMFFGGYEPEPENLVVAKIYDNIADGAESIVSIGIHTGAGNQAQVQLLVSHPKDDTRTLKFGQMFPEKLGLNVTPCSDVYVPLPGDLVDYLEKYTSMGIPTFTADLEFGTNGDLLSRVIAFGDAVWDMSSPARRLSIRTKKKMLASYYPTGDEWRQSAMRQGTKFINAWNSYIAAIANIKYMPLEITRSI